MAAFPAYEYSGLTELGYDRYRNVVEPLKGCLPTYTLATSTEDVLFNTTKPGSELDPMVKRYAELTDQGRKRFKGPILVLAGELDEAIYYPALQSLVNDTCSMLTQEKWGKSLDMVTYTGVNHFPLIQAGPSKWLSWVKDRLTGKAAPGPGCVSSVVKGFRTEFTEQGAAPNFFLDAISPAEGWKAAF